MAFPRVSALAEVTWTPRDKKDIAEFLERLPYHLQRLSILDVNYRPLDAENLRNSTSMSWLQACRP